MIFLIIPLIHILSVFISQKFSKIIIWTFRASSVGYFFLCHNFPMSIYTLCVSGNWSSLFGWIVVFLHRFSFWYIMWWILNILQRKMRLYNLWPFLFQIWRNYNTWQMLFCPLCSSLVSRNIILSSRYILSNNCKWPTWKDHGLKPQNKTNRSN